MLKRYHGERVSWRGSRSVPAAYFNTPLSHVSRKKKAFKLLLEPITKLVLFPLQSTDALGTSICSNSKESLVDTREQPNSNEGTLEMTSAVSLHQENVKTCRKAFSCNLVSDLLTYGPAAAAHPSKEAEDLGKQTEEATAVSPQPADKMERQKVRHMIRPHTAMHCGNIQMVFRSEQ